MRTAKHTPGPWEAMPDSWADGHADISSNTRGALAVVVVKMEGQKGNDPEGEANARLIRAAPEMRALLCAICDSTNEAEEYAAIQAAEILLARVDGTEAAA